MPEEDMGYLFANIQLPDAASLQRSDASCQKELKKSLENTMMWNLLPQSLQDTVCFQGVCPPMPGFIFISLKDWKERERTANEIVAARLSMLIFIPPINEAQVAFAFGPPAIPGLGSGSGFTLMIQDTGLEALLNTSPAQTANFIQAATETA